MRPNCVSTLQMIYIIFFVLISINVVQGLFDDELKDPNGIVYKYNDEPRKYLGQGRMTKVIKGTRIEKKRTLVAMKFERYQDEKDSDVLNEKKIYRLLDKYDGIPTYYDCLSDPDGNRVLITQLLGKNLHRLRLTRPISTNYAYSVKTTMMIGIEALKRIEDLHNKNIVHGDIKPDNFAVGYEDPSKIYILDFGLSHLYRKDGTHIRRQSVEPRGTPEYLSIHAHNNLSSRRNDIESLAYMLIEFLRVEELPWKKYKHHPDVLSITLKMKNNIPIKDIVDHHTQCKETLIAFLEHARGLEFEEKPKYDVLKQLLVDELTSHKLFNDKEFDWMDSKTTGCGGCTIC